jgi:hypothetical protein
MPLFKCSSCGHILADTAVRCPGCGTPGPVARHPNNWRTAEPESAIRELLAEQAAIASAPDHAADDRVARAYRLTAEATLKKEHSKLIAGFAAAGTVITILTNVILLVLADKIGGGAGGACLILVSIAAAALFFTSLLPSKAERFNITNERVIDPVTGAPLRMLWFFRWMIAMIALWTMVGSSDYFNKPQTLAREAGTAPVAASSPADVPPPDLASMPDSTVSPDQKAFALRAYCGSIVGAASAAPPGEDKKTMQTVAILGADQVIAKKYNLRIDQANMVLLLAVKEQNERGGEERTILDTACNPL